MADDTEEKLFCIVSLMITIGYLLTEDLLRNSRFQNYCLISWRDGSVNRRRGGEVCESSGFFFVWYKAYTLSPISSNQMFGFHQKIYLFVNIFWWVAPQCFCIMDLFFNYSYNLIVQYNSVNDYRKGVWH